MQLESYQAAFNERGAKEITDIISITKVRSISCKLQVANQSPDFHVWVQQANLSQMGMKMVETKRFLRLVLEHFLAQAQGECIDSPNSLTIPESLLRIYSCAARVIRSGIILLSELGAKEVADVVDMTKVCVVD